MKFLHYQVNAGPSDVVLVTLDCQANVRLLDAVNYSAYRAGRRYTYTGGLAKKSPIRISPPCQGHWHVVIDLGGYAGTVKASVQVV